MSASGDPGQAPGGQESPVSVAGAGAWAPEARGGNGVAFESGLPRIEVAGVVEPVGGLWEGLVESGLPEMEVALESGPPQMEVTLESRPPEMEVALESGPPLMEVTLESRPPEMEVTLESRPPEMEVALESGPPQMEVAESGPPQMEVALESGLPRIEVIRVAGPPRIEVAFESGIPRIEVAEVAGPVRALGEAAVGLGLSRGPEGGSAEAEDDDSDFGPAEEDGEEQLEEGLDILVDAHQFPMVDFRFMFLDLVHSLLHRIYHNNHILVRPGRGRVMVRPGARSPDAPSWHPAPPAAPPARVAPTPAPESEGSSEEEAAWETAEEPDEEPEEGPATPKGEEGPACPRGGGCGRPGTRKPGSGFPQTQGRGPEREPHSLGIYGFEKEACGPRAASAKTAEGREAAREPQEQLNISVRSLTKRSNTPTGRKKKISSTKSKKDPTKKGLCQQRRGRENPVGPKGRR